MTLQVAGHMRFLHERYFGRPSCPNCGELMIAPEYPEFTECRSGDEILPFLGLRPLLEPVRHFG